MENSFVYSKIKDTFVAQVRQNCTTYIFLLMGFVFSIRDFLYITIGLPYSHGYPSQRCMRIGFGEHREAAAFLVYQTKFSFMPKPMKREFDANNSTVNSTSGHDTATRHPILSITRYDADDLMQTTLRLGGEEALERLGLLVRHPNEDFAAEQAMRSLLNYYANVRYLCARLRGVILHAEASGAGKIRRKETHVRPNHP